MRASAILGAMVLLAACASAGGQENGDDGEARAMGQRSFDVGAFDKVALSGSHDVIVTVGGAPSVRAEGDAEALERLEVTVENGRLDIGTRQGFRWFSGRRRPVTVHVTVPALSGAYIGGSGDMRIDRVEAPSFEAAISGSGSLQIAALRAGQANFAISGSGGIRAAGNAEEGDVSIAGSGDMGLAGLEMRRASVSVAGSGNVSLRATEVVDGSIMGSGNLIVRGPARCSVSKMGSGNVHCSNA